MRCRQNWSESCENTLNEQIKTEYTASYKYHQIAAFFYRDDIGLNKLGDYFNKASLEEREHADKFLKYQTMRGGVAKLQTLPIEELDLISNIQSKYMLCGLAFFNLSVIFYPQFFLNLCASITLSLFAVK